MKTFVELCLSRAATPDQIDDFVHRWHLGNTDCSLRTYLGLTEAEYERWIHEPTSILGIIEQHRKEQG